jgi:hypothetical protein
MRRIVGILIRAWPSLLYVTLGLAFCAPLFERPLALGHSDWDQHLFYRASVLKSVIEYGQLPFWNPWYCGGNVLWQNPQVPLLSPTFALTALMPLPLAMKVDILLHYLIGLAGMHVLLARGIGLRSTPLAIFLASTFALSGALAMHLTAGHTNFLPAFYLPALLFFFLRALQRGTVRDALLGGAVLAAMIYNGGAQIVPMALLAVGSIALAAAVLRRQVVPLVMAAVLAGAGILYAAPKLAPVAAFAASDRLVDRRSRGAYNYMTGAMIARAYLYPFQDISDKLPRQPHRWHEFGNYVGPLTALLIAVSIAVALRGKSASDPWLGRALALSTAVTLSVALGEFHPLSPAALLRSLPFFELFRIPSRYTIVFLLLASLTMAWVAREILRRMAAGTAARAAIVVACGLATLHLALANGTHLGGAFREEPIETRFDLLARPPAPAFDAETPGRGSGSPMLGALMAGTALFQCYEPLGLRRTADGRKPLVYAAGTDRRVQLTAFSPNRIEALVAAGASPAVVFLNQNHADGWTSTAGPLFLDPDERRTAVRISGGEATRVAFVFVPPRLGWGLAIFAVALGATPFLWRRRLAVPRVGEAARR